MSRPSLVCVMTTIQPPTDCARRLDDTLKSVGARAVVVGDKKGPARFELPCADFFSLADQQRLPYRLAALLPTGHYTRKNLGYLLAVARGAQCLYETDDDNRPNDVWRPRNVVTQAQPVTARPWMNVYRVFADANIWPRGFPLDRVSDSQTWFHDSRTPQGAVYAPIQQGLADLAPDVDAVWRLVLDREFYFRPRPSLWLPLGTWCPFNSQTTWWWPEAYPLLYLPSHCSFRMTDIWRSFVAQRCLWEMGHGLVFHAAEAIQLRNVHDLLRDFRDEVPGYLHNGEIVRTLERTPLQPGPSAASDNLVRCYEALVTGGFIPEVELSLVRAWVADLTAVRAQAPGVQAA
jgi:hypothetical protein